MRTTAKTAYLIVVNVLLLLFANHSATAQQHLTIDAHAATTPFPHFWEQTFGSGRAILALRQSYRDDLRTVKQATDFQSIRFHAIFHDEVGLYDPDRKTINFAQTAGQSGATIDASVYNFSYVDQIYDGLLAEHVRPYVELSFMPKKMSSDPAALHAFWYKPNVAPPKDYALWDAMITAFAQHLVNRYGLDEVATWKFEVWNEPNIDFWVGNPKQSTYFQLYDHTARALKAVSPRLQVGGPSTAQAAWVTPFLAHTHADDVPVDFVSTHVYANDTADNVLGTNEKIPRDTMVFRAVQKVHNEIAASAYPNIPLIFSEYNASYANEPNVTDSTFMGPWLANNIRLCDGLTQSMAYWAFSDVFEEQGVVRTPFYGGFGLIAADNIPKPTLNIFTLLHKLGDRRIAADSDSALVTAHPIRRARHRAVELRAAHRHRPHLHHAHRSRRSRKDLRPRNQERPAPAQPPKSGASTTTTATSSKPSTPWAARPAISPRPRSPSCAPPAQWPHPSISTSTMAICASPSPPTAWP